jgi:hypothetical protein
MIVRALTPTWQIAEFTGARHAVAGSAQTAGIADFAPGLQPRRQMPGQSSPLVALTPLRITPTTPWQRET